MIYVFLLLNRHHTSEHLMIDVSIIALDPIVRFDLPSSKEFWIETNRRTLMLYGYSAPNLLQEHIATLFRMNLLNN